MRVRPKEVKLIRELLLDEEWADEDECAEAIVRRLDDMRGRERDYYCLAVQHTVSDGKIVTLMYGPFDTEKGADRAYKKGTGQVSDADRVAIFKMTTPLQAELALDTA